MDVNTTPSLTSPPQQTWRTIKVLVVALSGLGGLALAAYFALSVDNTVDIAATFSRLPLVSDGASETSSSSWELRERWERALGAENSAKQLAKYRSLRGACQWTSVDTVGYLNLYTSTKSYETCRPSNEPRANFANHKVGKSKCHQQLKRGPSNSVAGKVTECEFGVPDSASGSRWVVQRMGPFKDIKADGWVQLGWALEGKLRASPDKQLHVAGHYISPVDAETGEPLGNPPLHIHHTHVMLGGVRFLDGFTYNSSLTRRQMSDLNRPTAPNDVKRPEWKLFAQAHGDTQCSKEEGGMACLMEVFPEPHVQVADDLMGIDADLNTDPALQGTLPEFYFEVALLVRGRSAPRPSVPVGYTHLLHMRDKNLGRQSDNYGVYHIPPGKAAWLRFYQVQQWYSGQYLWNTMHVHPKFLDYALIFKADSDHALAPLVQVNPALETHPMFQGMQPGLGVGSMNLAAYKMTNEDARTLLLEECAKKPDDICMLMCELKGSGDPGDRPDGVDAEFDQARSPLVCGNSTDAHSFNIGDSVTLVSLSDTRTATHEIPLHLIFRGYYLPKHERPGYGWIYGEAGGQSAGGAHTLGSYTGSKVTDPFMQARLRLRNSSNGKQRS